MTMSFAELELGEISNIDSIEDGFVTLPQGRYSFLMKAKVGENDKEAKKKDGTSRTKWRVDLSYEVQEVIEIADGATPPKVGVKHTEFGDLDAEGLRWMKQKLRAVGEAFGTENTQEILTGLEAGVLVTAAVTHRKYKDKDGIEQVSAQVSDNGFVVAN